MNARAGVRICLALGLSLIVVGAIAFFWAQDRYTRPGPLTETGRLVIEPGSSLSRVGDALFKAGIVDQPLILRLGVRFDGLHTRLQAGEYDFPPRLSMRDAARLIASGKTVRRKLTIAEGLNIPQVASLISTAEGMLGTLSASPFGEGDILPETYFYSWGDRREALVARMKKAMVAKLAELWALRLPGLLLRSPREALILASMIEKETGRSGERARVSAVFHNRLRKGMRLQSDPTVVYAIGRGAGRQGRPLSRADLKFVSPYNTYLNAGLPPGPIASPGEAAIRAALAPAKTGEFYFVADGSGGHLFARTLRQHNRNVVRWRRLQRNLRKSTP
jgi:UPF0755 protein